jgi:hypothetical protein
LFALDVKVRRIKAVVATTVRRVFISPASISIARHSRKQSSCRAPVRGNHKIKLIDQRWIAGRHLRSYSRVSTPANVRERQTGVGAVPRIKAELTA